MEGNYTENYNKCIELTNGQHSFGVTQEELNQTPGITSFPCKNCGFLLVWNPFLKL